MPARKYLIGFLFFALAAIPAFPQSESASIVGTVTDSSGAAIPGVNVSITSTTTNATVTVQTATDGNYTSPPLQPGRYSVTAEAQGFTQDDPDHKSRRRPTCALGFLTEARRNHHIRDGGVERGHIGNPKRGARQRAHRAGRQRPASEWPKLHVPDLPYSRNQQFRIRLHYVARREQSARFARRFGERHPQWRQHGVF